MIINDPKVEFPDGNPYEPAVGLVEVVLGFCFRYPGLDMRVCSIGPSEIDGEVSTLVRLEIAGHAFELNMNGSWSTHADKLRGAIQEFITDHGLV